MASKVKYVASGFLEDAGRLLNEYIEAQNPLEFSTFASVWRKHKFSLIFMGRPDDFELTEFTNEAFRIATQFLSTTSFTYQVGTVFLLYALFRNQISDPPIKIRIELSHWLIIKAIRQEAIDREYRCLHYVIDYLISNAFVHVKNQTLRGPATSSVQKVSKNSEKIANFHANYKIELTDYSSSNHLAELQQLQRRYMDVKKKLDRKVKLNYSANPEIYEKLLMDLDNILKSPRSSRKLKTEDIGDRRAELKAASFSRKPASFRGRTTYSDDDFDPSADIDDIHNPDFGKKGKYRFKRGRKGSKAVRKVGRPRKKPRPTSQTSEEEPVKDPVENIDLSSLLQQQQDFFLPPEPTERRRARSVRTLYYKLSPKRTDEDSS